MAKLSQTPLSRTSRLLDLVPYLSAHQGIDLNILAKEFSVTSQQMVSDLTTLWMCGLPGYTPLELMDLSFDSGYVTIHNAETLAHPRNLSNEESIALLLGLDVVMQSLPKDRLDLIESAKKLIQRLSAHVDLPSQLHADSYNDETMRATISSAIDKKSSLNVTYHSLYTDEVTERIVHPLELRVDLGFEYLSAYCEKASDFRSFRVDRITQAHMISGHEISFKSHGEVVADSIKFTVKVSSRLRDVMERFALSPMQMAPEISGSSFSEQWLIRSVMASSGAVELISPPEVRASLAASAAALLERYTSA